jgi:hypothetical protein
MKLIVKLFFGIVALIVWLSVWLFGEPPAISLFWDRADVIVTNHETREVNDGWGIVQRTDPIVEVADGSHVRGPIRLLVREAVGDRDASIDRWPVGLTVPARISPGGDIAYPSNWRPFMLVPALALTILFAFLAYAAFRPFLERRWRAQGGDAVRGSAGMSFRPIAFFFGLIFMAVPLVLAFFFWTFGDPPPYSIAWPRSDMVVASSQVRPHQVGNGTMAAYVDVMVTAANQIDNGGVPLQGITWGWIPIPEAQQLREARYLPGDSVRAMQSPDGEFYVVRWRFADFLALLIIPLGLISMPVGLFALRLAFT